MHPFRELGRPSVIIISNGGADELDSAIAQRVSTTKQGRMAPLALARIRLEESHAPRANAITDGACRDWECTVRFAESQDFLV